MKNKTIYKLVERVWLYLYESIYSNDTLRNYFDEDWFDDEYLESEKRKNSMPKGKVPLRDFLGSRLPMEEMECPHDLKCKK